MTSTTYVVLNLCPSLGKVKALWRVLRMFWPVINYSTFCWGLFDAFLQTQRLVVWGCETL